MTIIRESGDKSKLQKQVNVRRPNGDKGREAWEAHSQAVKLQKARRKRSGGGHEGENMKSWKLDRSESLARMHRIWKARCTRFGWVLVL